MDTHQAIEDIHPLRKASDPYILALEDPFYINYGSLSDHIESKDINRKKFRWPAIELISVKDGVLELLSSSDNKSFTIKIEIERDRFLITCNCCQLVRKLCSHAYQTIYKLSLSNGSMYFEQFSQGGLAELARTYKKYFTTKINNEGIHIKPKPGLGKLFTPLEISVASLANLVQVNLPAETVYNIEVPQDVVLGYAIIYSGRQYHPPFLLPYYGKLNKAGDDLKTFIDFIRYDRDIPAVNFTNEQRILNSICIEMWKLVQELPAKILKEPNYLYGLLSLFHLWDKAFPLLLKQRFIYRYFSFRLKFLQHKPIRKYMLPCNLQMARPQLSLMVNRKEETYKVTVIVTVNGKQLRFKKEDNSFLMRIYNKQDNFYLLPSLKDAALIEWIGDAGDSVTVFQPHYKTFRDGLLKQLSEHYPVVFIDAEQKESANYCKVHQLQPVKKVIYFSKQGRWMLLTPHVTYNDGSIINALTNGLGWLTEKDGIEVHIQRDKKFENGLTTLIRSLHPDFISQVNTQSFYLTYPLVSQNRWLNKIQSQLDDAGIQIKGLDKLN